MQREAVEALINDEIDLAKSLFRDYINATIQFGPLADQLHKETKSLQRMFGPSGNPTARNLFSVIHLLQEAKGVKLKVRL